jgi:hypothetical protein
MRALRMVFEDRIISTGLWPLCSSDFCVCDFNLWGNLEGKMYNNPRTVEALNNDIRNVAASIMTDELQHVLQGLLQQSEDCLRTKVVTSW